MLMEPQPVRSRLLSATLSLVRQKGFDSTSVDEICKAAGVSKGAFFHHFENKEALAVAATQFWTTVTDGAFANAAYRQFEDPLDQLIGYIDFRAELLEGRSLPEFTCFLGMMVQEKYQTSPLIREACNIGITHHADDVAQLITAAKARHAPRATWSAQSLALHTQAVIQGAFILAKAREDASMAADSIRHLRRYIEMLFHFGKED